MTAGLAIPLVALSLHAPAPVAPRFTEEAKAAGLARPAKRVVWADLDGDTWPDAVLDRREVFWNRRGRGPGGRIFVPAGEGTWDPAPPPGEAGFVLFGDVDGDGDTDAVWGDYLDLERPRVEHDEVVRDEAGRPLPAVEDPGHRTRVYLNDGHGHLEALRRSGLEQPATTATAGAFLDYDGDGLLDLFLGTWYREYGVSYRAYSDRLYRGVGGGRFEDVTAASGVETRDEVGAADGARPTYGVTHCDWDGDGDQDVLVETYGRQANVLWRNNGDGTFTDVAPATGFDGDDLRDGDYPCIERETEPPFRVHGNTFDAACADYDGDGDMDVLLGEITHWWAGPSSDLTEVLRNQGPVEGNRFDRLGGASGLVRPHLDAWRWNQGDIHVGWLDVDNDGLLDALVASGDYPDGQFLRIWRQREDGTFIEVTDMAGIHWEACGAVSVGDFDRDGDADVLVGRSLFRLDAARRDALGPEAGLWVNRRGQDSAWIGFLVRGSVPPGPNRAGIGARVVVEACGRRLVREVLSSRGHAGHADSPELLFGLGTCRGPARGSIRWPVASADLEEFGPLVTGRYYLLEPGARPRRLRLR